MDIYWYGQACFKIKGKNATVVVDPYDSEFTGLKLPKDLDGDIVLITHEHRDHSNGAGVVGEPKIFTRPGEYESKGVIISGISSDHDSAEGKERGKNTIYCLLMDGLNIVHMGDFGQTKLSEEQVQLINETDILLIPVGGIFTIDSKGAAEIISQLEPKIIIPMHYKTPGLKFELEGIEGFLKEMGAENVLVQPKLSITKEKLPEEPMVVVLNKT